MTPKRCDINFTGKRAVEKVSHMNCNFPHLEAIALRTLEFVNVFLEALHIILKSDCMTICGVNRPAKKRTLLCVFGAKKGATFCLL